MLLSILAALSAVARADIDTFSVYTEPIDLRHGQVHNEGVTPILLPDWVIKKYAQTRMGVIRFDFDIVRYEGAKEVRVPLSEVYNHHTIQIMGRYDVVNMTYSMWKRKDPLGPVGPIPHCGTNVGHPTLSQGQYVTALHGSNTTVDGIVPAVWVGPVGGAEYRDAERDLPAPYRQVVDTPQAMTAILHLINTRGGPGPDDWPRLFECPCTSDRKIDVKNGTVDGVKPLPFHCTAELIAQKNPDCKLAWYKGGYRCCENGNFVVEHPERYQQKDRVFGKFTFRVEPVYPGVKSAMFFTFDVTGANAEYSIEACDPKEGTVPREECVHVATTVVDIFPTVPGQYFELITARGHQHLAGLGMEIYDDKTGQLLCASKPRHGTGAPTDAGNEGGYIVGIPPCVWGPPPLPPPPRFKFLDKMRIVSRYNSTETHHGVMGLWFVQFHIPPRGGLLGNETVLV